jgi:uncharacterized protein (DUF302 family)
MNSPSSAGLVSNQSGASVQETVDRLTRLLEDRGFTLFRVVDHSGTAERAGVQMPQSKLVMFEKPSTGAAVMAAAPLAGFDLPLRVLVCEDGDSIVSVTYSAPNFLAERYGLDDELRAPFDAVESIVDALCDQT